MIGRLALLLVIVGLVAGGVPVGIADAAPLGDRSGTPEAKAGKRKPCTLKRKAKNPKCSIARQKIGKRDLRGADLGGALISGSVFAGTDLRGASFENARLTGVTFDGVDLARTSFAGARLHDVLFVNTKVARPRVGCLSDDVGSGVVFSQGCSLAGASFAGATFRFAAFIHADLDYADFTGVKVAADASGGELIIMGSRARWARFVGADRVHANSGFDETKMVLGIGADGRPAASFITSRRQSDVSNAIFDDATDLTLGDRTVARNAVFVGTTFRTPIDRKLVDVAGAIGLDGSIKVTASLTADLDPNRVSIQLIDSSRWSRTRTCLEKATCSIAVGTGSSVTVKVVAPFEVGIAGLACTPAKPIEGGLYSTSCPSAAFSEPGSASYAILSGRMISTRVRLNGSSAAAEISRTIIQIADSENGFGDPAAAAVCQASGVCTGRVVLCGEGSSCSASVPVGAWVRVTMLRAMSNAYFAVNCPGETGDPVANGRTEWPTGDGVAPPYALRRVCTFLPTADTALDIVVDHGS